MKRMASWALLLVVVIAAGFAAYLYYHPNVWHVATKNANNETPYSKNPNAPGTPQLGTIRTISAGSLSIQISDGTIKTYNITAATPVVSTVQAGEVGKGLSTLKQGAYITVTPSEADSAVASTIEVGSPVGLQPAQSTGTQQVTLYGRVIIHSANSLQIFLESQQMVQKIAVTKDTKILSKVVAGQKGKDYASITNNVTWVQAVVTQTSSTTSAVSIQIMTSLGDAIAQEKK